MAANPLPVNRVYFIAYPLEDVIACKICANGIHRDENGNLLLNRQRGVFKAESRRRNYVLHLNRKHQVPRKNVRIRCSICGRVSDKPSRTAWRDARTHHQREHIADPVAVEAEAIRNDGNEVPAHEVFMVPVVVEAEAMGNDGDEVPVEEVAELPYVDNAPKEAVNRQAEILQALQPENVENGDSEIRELFLKTQLNVQRDSKKQHTPKELEYHLSKSTIIKGMGRMFDVIYGAAADPLAFVHSTPQNLPQPTISRQQELSFSAVEEESISRIVPRARRPLRNYKRKRLLFERSSTDSRKKFCP